MENLYRRFAPSLEDSFEFVTRSQIEENTASKEEAILPSGAHIEVAKKLEVPELSGELERAIWQVEQGFAKEKEAAKQKEALAKSSSEEVAEKNDESK